MSNQLGIVDIKVLRETIDEVDSRLVKALCERAELMPFVRDYKKTNGLPIVDVDRERAKMAWVKAQVTTLGLPPIYVTAVYREIMNIGVRIQLGNVSNNGHDEHGGVDHSGRLIKRHCVTCNWNTLGVTEPILGLQVCVVCQNPLV